MNNKHIESYIHHVATVQWKAHNLAMQANHLTAAGNGLDEFLRALELPERSLGETDQEVRRRIDAALES